ncbi:MAG: hypothetical protein WCA78_14675 [Rhizomicrobium sp.]
MKSKPNCKMPLTKLPLLILVAAVSILACGCSLDPDNMAPDSGPPSSWNVGRSVRVMDVTSGFNNQDSFFGGPAMIDNDQFKTALVLTLKKSNLFSDVSTDHGDLDLYATIKSQKQNDSMGVFQYTAEMLVSYRFVDRGGKEVWSASYESEFSSTAFAGATRTLEAREGSARENLSSLLQGIREHWPRNN